MKCNKKFKAASFAMLAIMLIIAIFAGMFTACAKKVQPESLKLNTNGVTTEFYLGEEFSASGLRVIVVMSDGSEENAKLSDCQIVAPDMTTAGEKTVTVSYQKLSASYKITVKEMSQPSDWEPDFTVDPAAQDVYELSAVKAKLKGSDRLGPSDVDPEHSVGGMIYGDTVTFMIESAAEAKANLWVDFDHTYHGNTAVNTLMQITVNGMVMSTDAVFNPGPEGHEHVQYMCYQKTKLGEITVAEGENTISIQFINNGSNLKGIILDFSLSEQEPVIPEEPDTEDPDTEEPTVQTYKFEAENAMLENAMIEYKSGVNASGDMLVGDMGVEGATVSFTVYADKACTADVTLKFASAAATTLDKVFSVRIGGALVDLSAVNVPAGSGERWYEWTTATITGVSLAAGENHIVITPAENGGANFDCVEFAVKDGTLTFSAAGVEEFKFDGTNASVSDGIKADYSEAGWLTGVKNGSEITFAFTSDKAATGMLALFTDHTGTVKPMINSIMEIKVNGTALETNAKLGYCGGACPAAGYHAIKCNLGDIQLNEGANTITIKFLADMPAFNGISVYTDATLTASEPENPAVPEAAAYRFEAENALLKNCMTEFKTGIGASGDMLVGDMGTVGATVTFTVYADKDCTADMTMRIASGAPAVLGNMFTVKVGDTDLNLSEINVPAGSGANWYQWTTATIENVSLKQGANTIVIGHPENGGSNFDYVEFAVEGAQLTFADPSATEYVFDGEHATYSEGVAPEAENEGWLTGIKNGSQVTFSFTASQAASGMLTIFIDHTGTVKPMVDTIMEISVNGVVLDTDAQLGYCSGVCPSAGHHAIACKLGNIQLNAEGTNTITITFKGDVLPAFNGISITTTAELFAL